MMVGLVECGLCGCWEARDTAIAAGWRPSYWIGPHTEILEPVCPGCVFGHCVEHDDGEIELTNPPDLTVGVSRV